MKNFAALVILGTLLVPVLPMQQAYAQDHAPDTVPGTQEREHHVPGPGEHGRWRRAENPTAPSNGTPQQGAQLQQQREQQRQQVQQLQTQQAQQQTPSQTQAQAEATRQARIQQMRAGSQRTLNNNASATNNNTSPTSTVVQTTTNTVVQTNERHDGRRDWNGRNDNNRRTWDADNDNTRYDGTSRNGNNNRDWTSRNGNNNHDWNGRTWNETNRTHNSFDSRSWRGWHGDRDIRTFARRDVGNWRRGHWYHGHHGGRDGWWWIVGSIFYPYAYRTAAYPDPYVPVEVLESGQYEPGYWYYCSDPEGYYPYVAECFGPWQGVPQ